MLVRWAFVDAQVLHLRAAQRPAGDHALDGLHDDALGETAFQTLTDRLGLKFPRARTYWGLLTRLAALVSVGFSIVLMLMFGWQGGTCIDEWTMAACNLAMGATLVLAGGGAYSLDNVLLKRSPGLADRAWFRWLAGCLPLPLTDTAFRNRFGMRATSRATPSSLFRRRALPSATHGR